MKRSNGMGFGRALFLFGLAGALACIVGLEVALVTQGHVYVALGIGIAVFALIALVGAEVVNVLNVGGMRDGRDEG